MKIVYTLVISLKRTDKQRHTNLRYSSQDFKEIENEIKTFSDKYVSEEINPEFSIEVQTDDSIEEKEVKPKKEVKHPGIKFNSIPKEQKRKGRPKGWKKGMKYSDFDQELEEPDED